MSNKWTNKTTLDSEIPIFVDRDKKIQDFLQFLEVECDDNYIKSLSDEDKKLLLFDLHNVSESMKKCLLSIIKFNN